MQLILTNSGTEPCLLKGFAGVSLTAGANGEPDRRRRNPRRPPPSPTCARAGPGRHRHAALHPGRQLPGLHPDPAAGFRVYPPEDTASLFLAQPRDACSNTDINLLTIGAFQAK